MSALRVVTVVGARPQFIKAAVVSRALRAAGSDTVEEKLVHTGQHYDDNMSDVFFTELDIPPPSHHLGVSGGTHGAMTGQMLERVERVLMDGRPDLVLVYGDTNSTLAGALAAVKLQIPVAHVEAGLRSGNLAMPEEVNRILTDRISRWLFCPTAVAVSHLAHEGVPAERIHRVGDVMFDAALYYRDQAAASRASRELDSRYPEGFCLATVHRAENTDDPVRLGGIVNALEEVAATTPVVMPLHPRTRARLAAAQIGVRRIEVLEPVGYLDMLGLLGSCRCVFTDSGGLQKEAFFFHKPCITMRSETEWTELVELGVNVVAGTDSHAIVAAWRALRGAQPDWDQKPYGDGAAGSRIAEVLLRDHQAGARPSG